MKDFWTNFGADLIGVFLGAMAHFGRVIHDEGWPPVRRVVGFLMQLGLVALVSAVVATKVGLASDLMKCLTASVMTVATNEVVSWVRARANKVLSYADGSGL